MHPRIASATSGFNTAWLALTLIVNVIMSGKLSIGEIFFFIGISFIGGFVFSKIVYFLINKYNR